jgi:Tfp pilus assembly protein PilO
MRSRAAIVGVLLTIVAVLVWNLLIFAPKGRDLSKAKKDTQIEEQKEPQLRAQLAALEEISKNGPEIAAKLDRLGAAVPTSPDLDGFILSANQIAVQSGIDWLSVSPGIVAVGTAGPSVIPLTISIKGGFFQVLDYLNRLEDMGRLVIVDGLTASASAPGGTSGSGSTGGSAVAPTTGAPTLAISLTARMFTMAPPAAAPGSTPPPASAGGSTSSTPPASGNSSGDSTSTTAQVN